MLEWLVERKFEHYRGTFGQWRNSVSHPHISSDYTCAATVTSVTFVNSCDKLKKLSTLNPACTLNPWWMRLCSYVLFWEGLSLVTLHHLCLWYLLAKLPQFPGSWGVSAGGVSFIPLYDLEEKMLGMQLLWDPGFRLGRKLFLPPPT